MVAPRPGDFDIFSCTDPAGCSETSDPATIASALDRAMITTPRPAFAYTGERRPRVTFPLRRGSVTATQPLFSSTLLDRDPSEHARPAREAPFAAPAVPAGADRAAQR